MLAICGLWFAVLVVGQSGSEYPRMPWGGYPYPASYDAEIADPDVHRVLFESQNIMFLEVANPPKLNVRMHGHAYPSVFARDTGASQATSGIVLDDTHLAPASPFAGKGWGQGPPPAGFAFPRCTTAPSEGAHRPLNHRNAPVHFYRIRRLDGDGLRAHWKDWYPWMLNRRRPVPKAPPGRPSSQDSAQQWPYSPLYDSVLAAPVRLMARMNRGAASAGFQQFRGRPQNAAFLAGKDDSSVNGVVGDQFLSRQWRSADHVVMQFDDSKLRSKGLNALAYSNRKLTLDRQTVVIGRIQGCSGAMLLGVEYMAEHRLIQTELGLHYRADAADLVTGRFSPLSARKRATSNCRMYDSATVSSIAGSWKSVPGRCRP
jgi:hypothetical protein